MIAILFGALLEQTNSAFDCSLSLEHIRLGLAIIKDG
jgi:hypothetical protein